MPGAVKRFGEATESITGGCPAMFFLSGRRAERGGGLADSSWKGLRGEGRRRELTPGCLVLRSAVFTGESGSLSSVNTRSISICRQEKKKVERSLQIK